MKGSWEIFTNHSFRATGATVLFNAGVPENLIQKRTGHKSLDALHTYEQVTPFQDHAVAQILSSSTNLPYNIAKGKADVLPAQPNFPISSADWEFLDNLPADAYPF